MVAASDRSAIAFSLAPVNAHAGPKGRYLIGPFDSVGNVTLLMDLAYEGDDTRGKAIEKGFIPVVPPQRRVGVSNGITIKDCTNSGMN